MDETDVVVVGAGQAGLSAAYHLRRSGLEPGSGFVVLDHSPAPGGAWQFRWPTLTYGRVHGMYALPGRPLTGADPDRPSAAVIGEYFAAYEEEFGLRVRRPVDVGYVREGPGGRLLVHSSDGEIATRALINATGTWERPFWPRVAGQREFAGRQLHTADYPGPEAFRGRRVLVVGGGTSGVQHVLELAATAARVTWVTRRPPVFDDRPFDAERGREVVAEVADRVRRGLPPRSVVSLTGLPMTDEIRAARAGGLLQARPMIAALTASGVRWPDGREEEVDTVLWATGFRPVVDHLAPLRLREGGGGIRMDGTRAVRDPRVHLVGYGPSASTIGANRAGRAAVREVRELLGMPRPAPGTLLSAVPVPATPRDGAPEHRSGHSPEGMITMRKAA